MTEQPPALQLPLGPFIVAAAGPAGTRDLAVEWFCDGCGRPVGTDGRVLWDDAAVPLETRPVFRKLFGMCGPACAASIRSVLPEVEWGEYSVAEFIAVLALGRRVGDRVVQLIREVRTVELLDDEDEGEGGK